MHESPGFGSFWQFGSLSFLSKYKNNPPYFSLNYFLNIYFKSYFCYIIGVRFQRIEFLGWFIFIYKSNKWKVPWAVLINLINECTGGHPLNKAAAKWKIMTDVHIKKITFSWQISNSSLHSCSRFLKSIDYRL